MVPGDGLPLPLLPAFEEPQMPKVQSHYHEES